MREVSVRMLHYLLELGHLAELDPGVLTKGLSSTVGADGQELEWVAWDDFAEILERLELRAGGPDAVTDLVRRGLPSTWPELRALAAVFAHPFPFLSFVVTRWKSTLYRHMAVPSVERLDDDRVRWMQTIPVPHRPCLAFHHFTIARVKVLPCHLGLPEATLESAALSPRSAELVFTLPTAPPSSARGTRAAPPPMVAAQLDEAYAKVAAALRANGEKGEPGASAAPATSSLAGDWSDRFRLSPRQRAVFALLLEGRANKDIAGVLACSERNVEFHVGRILRAAGVASRAELLAKVLGERPAT